MTQPTPTTDAATQAGVRLWLSKQASMLLMVFVLLFGLAGRLDWLWGWVQWLMLAATVVAQVTWVLRRNPALIAERSRLQRGSKGWDVTVALFAAVVLPLTAWAVAALDARYGWTTGFPVLLNVAGAVVFGAGYAVTLWAMAANAFFSATVRLQSDRGHTVVSDGPYRWMRHPGYLGAIVFQVGVPLLLGSWSSLVPGVASAALYVVRTSLEDRFLQSELPGYADYAARTRFRLIPGVW